MIMWKRIFTTCVCRGNRDEPIVLEGRSFRPGVGARSGVPKTRARGPTRDRHFKSFVIGCVRGIRSAVRLFPKTSFQTVGRVFKILCIPLRDVKRVRIAKASCGSVPGYCACVSVRTTKRSKVGELRSRPCLGLHKGNATITIVSSKVSCRGRIFQGTNNSEVTCL